MKQQVKSSARLALIAGAVAIVALVPATVASAADGAAEGDAATTGAIVSGLAADAAALVTEERDLVERESGDTAPDTGARLQLVDAAGHAVLIELDHLDVDLSPATRTALGMLPAPSADDASPAAPSPLVYEAAIAALDRIAATPEAVVPVPPRDGGRGQLVALIVGVALLFGLVARSSLARDRADDLVPAEWSDGLTGVADRRRLDHDVAGEGNRALGPTAVLMIDIDHFGNLNERFGARAGDDVLRRIGAMLTDEVRVHDVVYRYGGTEFCVLLRDVEPSDAVSIAARIVDAARDIVLPDGDRVTVSVGAAAGAPDRVNATLDSADRALLEAKAGGRDRLATDRNLQHA